VTKPTLLYTMLDRVLVCAAGHVDLADDEWSTMVGAMDASGRSSMDALIVTDANGPNASQRALLLALPFAKRLRVACVTRSGLVRGMVTALAWACMPIRAFSPDDVDDAATWLDLAGAEKLDAFRQLATLRARLAGAASLDAAEAALGVTGIAAAHALFQTSIADLERKLRGRPMAASNRT